MTRHLLHFNMHTGHIVLRKQDGEAKYSYRNLLDSDHPDDQRGKQRSSSPGAETKNSVMKMYVGKEV